VSQNHKNTLKLLMPIKLGEDHDADLTIDGDHLDQVQSSADNLLKNVFGDTTYELLHRWERTLGITPPDDASTSARVAACVVKIRERRGLSIPYFIELAASIGYQIVIVEEATTFQWRVDVQNADLPVHYFRAGESSAGDSLMAFGIEDLEGIFEDYKPAHTFVYFTY